MSSVSTATVKSLDELRMAALPPDLEDLEVGRDNNPAAVPAHAPWPALPDSLRLLIVWGSQLTDASFADGLSLRALYLSGKDTLDDISALARQSELEALVLDARALEDFAPLGEVPLQFFMAKRSRLSAWADLPAETLRWADLSKTRIKDGPDEPFPHLQYLALTQSRIRDLEPLGNCPDLRRVHLWKTKHARNFAALAKCRKLNIVNLNETTVSREEVEQLLELPELTILSCAKTPAAADPEFAALQEAARQRKVSLCGTHREFTSAHSFERRDLAYYLRVYQGERNPLRHLSRLGYRCGSDG